MDWILVQDEYRPRAFAFLQSIERGEECLIRYVLKVGKVKKRKTAKQTIAVNYVISQPLVAIQMY